MNYFDWSCERQASFEESRRMQDDDEAWVCLDCGGALTVMEYTGEPRICTRCAEAYDSLADDDDHPEGRREDSE